jgi:hypothetical protein
MRHRDAVLISAHSATLSSGQTQHRSLILGARRLALHAHAVTASDHLALRLAASAALLIGLALAVWWAVGVFSDL